MGRMTPRMTPRTDPQDDPDDKFMAAQMMMRVAPMNEGGSLVFRNGALADHCEHNENGVCGRCVLLEVWPESQWPRFLLIQGGGLQSYTAWWHMINVSENQQNGDKRR